MAEPKVNLGVRIGSLILKNPVMPASGCFAHEYADAMDLGRLGALVTKSVTSMIAGTLNMIRTLAASSHGPNKPLVP